MLLKAQSAAQLFGDPLAYVEPESLPATDPGEVGQKDIFLVLRRDARPLVRNCDDQLNSKVVDVLVADENVDFGLFGRNLDGILNEVD